MSDSGSENRNVLVQSGILAITSVLVRVIGLIYRIPMTNTIGDGIAYYQTAFNIYSTVLIFSSFSLPSAVSKMISTRISLKQGKNIYRTVKASFLLSFFVGLLAGACTFVFSEFLAGSVKDAVPAIRSLSPAVFIMSILGVLRGIFQGMNTMVPTAFSQLIEQVVNAVVSVLIAGYLFKYGLSVNEYATDAYEYSFGAAGGALGTTCGALAAFIFCIFVFLAIFPQIKRANKNDRSASVESYPQICKILIVTAVPIILSTASINVVDIIDQTLFSGYLSNKGQSDSYKSIYTAYSAMANTMIHVPVAFASALGVSVIPSISSSIAKGEREQVKSRIQVTSKISVMIAAPCGVGLFMLAEPIIKLIFTEATDEAVVYLMLLAPGVVFISLISVTNGLLQGIGKLKEPVLNACISLIVHVGVMLVLMYVFDMGIYGVIISYIVFAVLLSCINLYTIKRISDVNIRVLRNFVAPVLCALIMGAIVFCEDFLFCMYSDNRLFRVCIGIFTGIIVYIWAIVASGCVSEDELREFPKGDKLLAICKKLHLM